MSARVRGDAGAEKGLRGRGERRSKRARVARCQGSEGFCFRAGSDDPRRTDVMGSMSRMKAASETVCGSSARAERDWKRRCAREGKGRREDGETHEGAHNRLSPHHLNPAKTPHLEARHIRADNRREPRVRHPVRSAFAVSRARRSRSARERAKHKEILTDPRRR